MSRWELDKDLTEKRTITVNGLELEVITNVYTCPDEGLTIDDLIDSNACPEITEKLSRDLESGRASVLIIKVEAASHSIRGVTGLDILGGVIVYGREDFLLIISGNNMRNTAIEEFKRQIVESYKEAKISLNNLAKFVTKEQE